MPITTVNRVPFGKIPAAQDVEPRQSILSNAPQAMESAAQKQQNAALVQFRAAGAVGDVTREIAAMGVQFLKPMDDLIKSRKVLEANNVTIDAILEGRRMADAAKRDGTPHTEYVQSVGSGWERISTNALHRVRHLGPAAVAHVSEALGNEKIRQYGQAQQYFFERETGEQKGYLEKYSIAARQDMTTTLSPAERVAIQARFDQEFDTAADSGVITRSDAEKSKAGFHLFTVEATAIQIARATKSIPNVMTYLNSANLTPQQVKEFENAAYDAIWYDEHQTDRAERAAAKAVNKTQEYLQYDFVTQINARDATPEKMEALRLNVQDAARRGDLTGDQSRQIDFWARDRIKELENPRQPQDDPTSYQAIVKRIQDAPGTMNEKEIQEMPGLTASTRQSLWNQLQETRSKNHFTHHDYYKMRLAELDGLAGEASKDDDAAWNKHLVDQSAGPVKEGLRARINRAKTGYYEALVEKTRPTHGIATYEQIKELDGYVESWKVQLRAPVTARPKDKPAVGNDGLKEFNEMKNAPKVPK